MAEFLPGNFVVNPQYATPEQLAVQRLYAAELAKRSGENVNRPAGAAANVLNAITSGLMRNTADTMQTDAATRNAARQSALIQQLQNGGKPNAANLAQIYADPMSSPETRALVTHLLTPQKYEDVGGRPGFSAPALGTNASPIRGGLQPGFRAPESAGPGGVSTVTPITATNPNGGTFGGLNYKPVGWDNSTPQAAPSGGGPTAPGAGLPPAPAPAGISPRLKSMAADARELGAENERVQGGAKGEGENIKSNVTQANTALQAYKDATVMEDLIKSNPNMEFGPWAKVTNDVLRVVQNLTGNKLLDAKALAASDAVEKLNLSLAASMQARWGLNPSAIGISQGSTPGNEKSSRGTLELLSLMKQGADRDHYIATTLYKQYADAGRLGDFPQAIKEFYKENPLKNPNTGHLVMDPVPVKSPDDVARLKLKPGTPIRLPDGRTGWVPNG